MALMAAMRSTSIPAKEGEHVPVQEGTTTSRSAAYGRRYEEYSSSRAPLTSLVHAGGLYLKLLAEQAP